MLKFEFNVIFEVTCVSCILHQLRKATFGLIKQLKKYKLIWRLVIMSGNALIYNLIINCSVRSLQQQGYTRFAVSCWFSYIWPYLLDLHTFLDSILKNVSLSLRHSLTLMQYFTAALVPDIRLLQALSP